jgi:hypothetical protein
MFFWTENPTEEMWNQIRYLKNPINVKNLLTRDTKSNRNYTCTNNVEERSFQISSCIRQADEYYKSSESVGLATQPLLQFYGAENLAKAAILANTKLLLSDINFHGLSTRANTAFDTNLRSTLQNYSNDPSRWLIEKEYAVTNDGVFPNLCKSIGEDIPQKGTVVYFKDIIKTLPDLSEIYSRHYSEPSNCFPLYQKPEINFNSSFEVIFGYYVNLDDVKSVFPEFEDYNESIVNNHPGFASSTPMTSFPSFCGYEKGTVSGKYLVRSLSDTINKSFTLIFLGLFILSNVVRYKPAFWMKEIEGHHSGSAPIIETFCNIAKHRLPNDALESIWWEKFKYGTPSYRG